ncbi:hypothetical protein H1R17_01905 [Flavobacterium sp. xlx-214]|uniref:hypothetical protein n=1 Tax=unclassified Flavobacterium TaxID=196869 RepID=UPI0013D1753D|nr:MULTISPECIES: hypothetical protein [unclassified Flavobacterium]MBA5792777.1 hypothetical protein [Flavobacterium sp. xlx-221]QMI83914.1 hypothetical protein H1R17_01905 [Flavobacterium sp. xlx-214]
MKIFASLLIICVSTFLIISCGSSQSHTMATNKETTDTISKGFSRSHLLQETINHEPVELIPSN